MIRIVVKTKSNIINTMFNIMLGKLNCTVICRVIATQDDSYLVTLNGNLFDYIDFLELGC